MTLSSYVWTIIIIIIITTTINNRHPTVPKHLDFLCSVQTNRNQPISRNKNTETRMKNERMNTIRDDMRREEEETEVETLHRVDYFFLLKIGTFSLSC
jgi:hypothetical protein